MIRLEGVSKRYADDVMAVEALDLEVEAGEILVLLGESGCGKTTTLRMINRLVEPTCGTISIDGVDVQGTDPVSLRRSIGYVFQGVGLFPHWSVARNVGAVPRLLGWPEARRRERVDELLALVGLDPESHRKRFPDALSGGQQQRVGVARALAARPKVMLMDEPFGALDPVTRAGLQDELLRMRDALGLTIVLVTHDVAEAMLLGDRLAVLDAGRLLQVGTPADLFAAPADPRVRALLETPVAQADRVHAIAHAHAPERP